MLDPMARRTKQGEVCNRGIPNALIKGVVMMDVQEAPRLDRQIIGKVRWIKLAVIAV